MRWAVLAVALVGCGKGTTTAQPVPTGGDVLCQVVQDGRNVCFPVGHVCTDPHGIGDGVPLIIDCYTEGSRMCHPASAEWPVCAGGEVQ